MEHDAETMPFILSTLNVAAAATTLIASIFLIRGYFQLEARDIVQLCMPPNDFNSSVAMDLITQRADNMVGGVMLIIAFFLQLIQLAINPGRWCDREFDKSAIFTGLMVALIIAIAGWQASAVLSQNMADDVSNLLNMR